MMLMVFIHVYTWSEIVTAAHMLVIGIDKVFGKFSKLKNFISGGLPMSQKYTGLHSV